MAVNLSSKIKRILYQSRFCEQKEFDIIVSGSTDVLKYFNERTSLKISLPDTDEIETIYHSKRHSYCDRTVCERSNVWNVCSRTPVSVKPRIRDKYKFVDSYKIYLNKTDQWINVIQIPDDRSNFNAFSFMKNIYVFGGFIDENKKCLKSCYKYDTKRSNWKVIASINDYRQHAACTVFEGKIVLTGGYDGVNRVELNSIEAYDHYENKWDFLPRMINRRSLHGAVCMGNKLFVIGGDSNTSCEVFDSSSIKFTSIKHFDDRCFDCVAAVSDADKVLAICSSFGKKRERYLTYNVDKKEWYYKNKGYHEFYGIVCLSKLSVI